MTLKRSHPKRVKQTKNTKYDLLSQTSYHCTESRTLAQTARSETHHNLARAIRHGCCLTSTAVLQLQQVFQMSAQTGRANAYAAVHLFPGIRNPCFQVTWKKSFSCYMQTGNKPFKLVANFFLWVKPASHNSLVLWITKH